MRRNKRNTIKALGIVILLVLVTSCKSIQVEDNYQRRTYPFWNYYNVPINSDYYYYNEYRPYRYKPRYNTKYNVKAPVHITNTSTRRSSVKPPKISTSRNSNNYSRTRGRR